MRAKYIDKLKIKKAKGLNDLEISFKQEGLTAILGPNGCGKSTILHLLACGYNPDRKDPTRIDYRFPWFFLPVSFKNHDQSYSWKDTRFTYTNVIHSDSGETPNNVDLEVNKSASRWMRYERRPTRWVSYIGIASSVPDIETEKLRSRIDYLSVENTEGGVLNDAKYILAKEYGENCICTRRDSRRNRRVKVGNTFYTSLSMGAGEQRVFTILEEVSKAPHYGLILIDEVDLLLHQASLTRLLKVLARKARMKHLQIVFTAHNQLILQLPDIEFRHIFHQREKSLCLPGNDPGALERLTGHVAEDIEIYVEDDLSTALVTQISSEEGCPKRIFISTFGAVSNAFSLVAATVGLRGLDQKKILFVLDGDCYRCDEDKFGQIKKSLTGTRTDLDNLRKSLLAKIKQFIIPEGSKPEEYYHSLIMSNLENVDMSDRARDLYQEIRNFNTAGVDHHKWFVTPMENLGMTREVGYEHIAEMLSKCAAWKDITSEIRIWIREQLGKVGSAEECIDGGREEQSSPTEE